MSKSAPSLFRAVSLITVAGMLGGCPVIEPISPAEEPESPTPASGVWGLHLADVQADGYCSYIAEEAVGRVLRMDVETEANGALALSIFQVDLFGGHADGEAWADAEHSGYLGWGWAEGDADPHHYDPEVEVELEEETAELESPVVSCDEGEESTGSDGSDAGDDHTDEGEDRSPHSDPPPCEEVEPPAEQGVFISFDADIRDAETMDGLIVLTVSNGYDACTFAADVQARFFGEEWSGDDEEDQDLIGYPEPGAATAPSPDPAPEDVPAR